MASFVLSFFPRDLLDEIWDLLESVSEGFHSYSFKSECFTVRIFRERLSNFVCVLLSLLVLRVGVVYKVFVVQSVMAIWVAGFVFSSFILLSRDNPLPSPEIFPFPLYISKSLRKYYHLFTINTKILLHRWV